MKKIAWVLSILLVSCGGYNTDNSVEFDASHYPVSEEGLSGGPLRFARASNVLRRHCISCHPDYSTLTENQFKTFTTIEKGDFLMAPGDLDASGIWRVLRSGGEDDYMPPDYTLSPEDLETIRDWILGA